MNMPENEKTYQSLRQIQWTVKNGNVSVAEALRQRFDLPEITARIMAARQITCDDAEAFLYPTLKRNLPNPFSLKDMHKAAERMAQAVLTGEPVGLMGDYDVDGATSTALLKMFLESCGITVYCFIPDREDGYGPNSNKMKEYKEKGCSVVATLDCGTTAFEAIADGEALGLDVLVLDHHDPDATRLPNAYALVNPKRLDEEINHPCRYLAAVGVVFLFTIALNAVLREKGFYQSRPEPNLMIYLDLVAFGTVCDVVKLSGVNRLFVKSGLKQMRTGQNLGLKALAELAQIKEAPDSYHLGYVFGPRINACGRVGKSDIGMHLLSAKDSMQAHILAQELEALNNTRREIESAVLQEAVQQVEKNGIHTPFIVVEGHNWHQGVVGIVAGRLKDKYNLPVFALSIENDEVKGSSRSVQGVDLGSLVMNAIQKGILSRGGGHPMAAGFSLKESNLPAFKQYLSENIKSEMLVSDGQKQYIDAVVSLSGVTDTLMDSLALLAPFGESNPEPIFMIKNVSVVRTVILKNGHISFTLSAPDGTCLNAIAFRSMNTPVGDFLLNQRNTPMCAVGVLKREFWRDKKRMQMQLIDIIPA